MTLIPQPRLTSQPYAFPSDEIRLHRDLRVPTAMQKSLILGLVFTSSARNTAWHFLELYSTKFVFGFPIVWFC